MRLNSLKPGEGAKQSKKRLGRGMGSGLGKTSGRGHKGQHARAGGFHKVGFEGGQMPMQRRLPKVGFKTQSSLTVAEIRLDQLAKVEGDVADLLALKKVNLVSQRITRVKVVGSGAVGRAITVNGLGVTKGARAAIEAAGGKVEG